MTGLLVIAFSIGSGGGTGSPTTVHPPPDVRHGCKSAQQAIRFYSARTHEWQAKRHGALAERIRWPNCRRATVAALEWVARARAARASFVAWWRYHWDWPSWLPDKWQRIGACETGYGRRPGQWTWGGRASDSGSYQGAFGFAPSSWDQFKYRADPRAEPYPAEAYQATPRQQYEVALAIWRRYGFSGWGCRGA